MKIPTFAKVAERFVADNSPVILTGVAVVGTAATAYLAARAAYKSREKLLSHAMIVIPENAEGKRHHEGDPVDLLSTIDKIKTVGPLYIPAVSAGVTTIAAIVCANRISTARVAAMAAAYSLSENKLNDYRHKIEEKLGLEGAQKVRDEVNEDKMNRTQKPSGMVVLGGGEVLCFDAHSGRYFKSTQEEIRGAMNDTNYEVIQNHYATLQFFWELIGLDATAYSEDVGWSVDLPLEVRFGLMMSSDDKPCLLVDYDVEPVRRWNHCE